MSAANVSDPVAGKNLTRRCSWERKIEIATGPWPWRSFVDYGRGVRIRTHRERIDVPQGLQCSSGSLLQRLSHRGTLGWIDLSGCAPNRQSDCVLISSQQIS